ncbi:uncharacterized protein BDZ99DRAFT_464240 [Mytilinidion resinicola]|uniref:Uncharacterized protein n=1 Tax=Mytilinidion resinicola TaxID=574789 RepID=A0A6A6YIH8_9PEZI|nr:uncharacterized protein BDZ99DRAFT_464240 [Mytilinidion resinicola]KAF2808358.1 hypothetical protein BDZ99DRAFT_464240 [Mytilinidion resinicola]
MMSGALLWPLGFFYPTFWSLKIPHDRFLLTTSGKTSTYIDKPLGECMIRRRRLWDTVALKVLNCCVIVRTTLG